MRSIPTFLIACAIIPSTAHAQSNDLILRSAGPNPVFAESGSRVTVDYVVRNASPIEADDVPVGFYFSNDNVLDAGDRLLESEDIDIDPYESEGDSEQFRIPSNLTVGNYFLIVAVNESGVFPESDFSNNRRALQLTITAGNVRATSTTRVPCSGTIIPESLETSLARIGDDSVGFIDDPQDVANLPVNTTTFWVVSGAPAVGSPCGVPMQGFGLGGAVGEILIDTNQPLTLVPNAVTWGGPGQPAWHRLDIPYNGNLLGTTIFTQGLFATPVGDLIVTNAVDLVIGS